MWIGNGGIADVHVVNAVVDHEAGHRGQGVFIVPGGTPGLSMVRKLDKLGCRASHTAEIVFDGVRVPGENLLGGEEKLQERRQRARVRTGRKPIAPARRAAAARSSAGSATMGTFEQTRPMVAAQAIGIARAALEYAPTTPPGVRRSGTDHRQSGHRVPAGRPRHRDRRGAPADLAGLLDGRPACR